MLYVEIICQIYQSFLYGIKYRRVYICMREPIGWDIQTNVHLRGLINLVVICNEQMGLIFLRISKAVQFCLIITSLG